MKKLIVIATVLLLSCCTFAFAQEKSERNEEMWSATSYYNVPILKIYEAREGYVVVYQKNNVGSDTTVIPKAWAKGTEENPKKLKFRTISGNLAPFMSIVKQDGTFSRVILSVPMSRSHHIWGVSEYMSKELEGVDKETLEDLQLY